MTAFVNVEHDTLHAWRSIEVRTELSERVFNEYYLKKGVPVLVKGFAKKLDGLGGWGFEYLKEKLAGVDLPLKSFYKDGSILLQKKSAEKYIESVISYEKDKKIFSNEKNRPAYCHDIPIFSIAKHLVKDVKDIPSGLFPKWYRKSWWDYAQFFMSSSDSCTPLHYDTLLTNNLFFQIKGTKEFTLLPFSESKYCYRRDWRWYEVDPKNIDYEKYPEFRDASVTRVVVEEGDLLFMPSGMLHHVVTKEASISFNVDFHTPATVVKSFAYIFKGMPKKNIYYNTIVLVGLLFKIPNRLLFPFYKSYLNYIS